MTSGLCLQIVQVFKPDDCLRRLAFAEEILQHINDDNDYLKCVVFSDIFSCIQESQ